MSVYEPVEDILVTEAPGTIVLMMWLYACDVTSLSLKALWPDLCFILIGLTMGFVSRTMDGLLKLELDGMGLNLGTVEEEKEV